MARRWFINETTGIIEGVTDNPGAPVLDGTVAVIILEDANGIPARGIQAGGHWDVETQTYTQSEQSIAWEQAREARGVEKMLRVTMILAMVLLMIACGSPVPEPTAVPTMIPTVTPTPVPTMVPTPTAAATPTEPPVPTSTPISVPVPTQTPACGQFSTLKAAWDGGNTQCVGYPFSTPTPTPRPTPTVTPQPTATPTPTPTPVPEFTYSNIPRGFDLMHLISGNTFDGGPEQYAAYTGWNPDHGSGREFGVVYYTPRDNDMLDKVRNRWVGMKVNPDWSPYPDAHLARSIASVLHAFGSDRAVADEVGGAFVRDFRGESCLFHNIHIEFRSVDDDGYERYFVNALRVQGRDIESVEGDVAESEGGRVITGPECLR